MHSFLKKQLKRKKERKIFAKSIQNLLEEERLSIPFILFTVLSSAIATLGIVMHSSSILIGSMLIAPLLIPVIGLSIGVGCGSVNLVLKSLQSLFLGMLVSIVVSYILARRIMPIELDETLYRNFSDSFLYALVAFFSGILAVYSWLTPRKTDKIIPGVGVAVALVPPLSFLGVVLASGESKFLTDILQLIFVNLFGIFIGGYLTYLISTLLSKHSHFERGKEVEKQIEKISEENKTP